MKALGILLGLIGIPLGTVLLVLAIFTMSKTVAWFATLGVIVLVPLGFLAAYLYEKWKDKDTPP